MSDAEENVLRREFFPEDTPRTEAIEDVEQRLRERYDVEEIGKVEAAYTMGDELKVEVLGVLESLDGGEP